VDGRGKMRREAERGEGIDRGNVLRHLGPGDRVKAEGDRAPQEHDAAAITALYAKDAFWQQHPFREPELGYLTRVFGEEESADCHFGTPIVDGDQAAVPWFDIPTHERNGDWIRDDIVAQDIMVMTS